MNIPSKPQVPKGSFNPVTSHQPKPAHHSGKGTKARLNTAAGKAMFGSKYSK